VEYNSFFSLFNKYNNKFSLIKKPDRERKCWRGMSNLLETLLKDFRYAKRQGSRDKIYRFLGLAHDCEDGNIEADYSTLLFYLYSDVIRFFWGKRKLSDSNTNVFDKGIGAVRFSKLVYDYLAVRIYR
jgi:hypothetical protein